MPLSQLRILAQSQAVKIFTDREHYKESFDHWFGRHVGGIDPWKVLVYYGVGGIGKSRLLQELIKRAGTSGKPIRIVKLDFDSDEIDSPALALAAFRRQWGGTCPLFDFALGRFWQMGGRSVESLRKQALPEDGFLYELANFASSIASGGFFSLGLVKELWKKQEALRSRYGSLSNDFASLEELPIADLALRLPLLLGDAVRKSAAESRAPQPLLVCIDGHERLLTRDYKLGKLHGDEWLKELIACAEFGLYVICGRNQIPWSQKDRDWTPYIDQHLLGGLGQSDADKFLASIPVVESGVRRTIIRAARGVPLFLDLCASIYLVKTHAGEGVRPSDFDCAHDEVIDRFLECLDRDQAQAVRALSVLESFDRRVFTAVIGVLNIRIPTPLYDEFCAASYATGGDSHSDVRAIHPIVREYLREHVDPADLVAIVRAVLEEAEKSAADGDASRAGRVLGSVAASAALLQEAKAAGLWRRMVVCAFDLADAGFPAEAEVVANALGSGNKSACLETYRSLIKAHCLRRTGDLVGAKTMYATVRRNQAPTVDPEIALLGRFQSAHVDHLLGRYDAARSAYERIVGEGGAVSDDDRSVLLARRQLGDIALISGRFSDALERFRECAKQRRSDVLWQLECERFIGHAYRFNWMLGEAKNVYLDVASRSDHAGLRGMYAKALVNLAETCWHTEPAKAFEWACEGIRLNEKTGNAIEIGKALTAAALVNVVQRDFSAADEYLERAEAVQAKTGYRSGLAFVQVARCFRALAVGDRSQMAACMVEVNETTRAVGVYKFLRVICSVVCPDQSEAASELGAFQWLDPSELKVALIRVRTHLCASGLEGAVEPA